MRARGDEAIKEIDRRFDHHAEHTEHAIKDMEVVRRALKGAATTVAEVLGPGRERSMALTKLEEATYWSIAALARPPSRE